MSLKVRKSAEGLNKDEKVNYANAFSDLYKISQQQPWDNRGYYYYAGLHGWPNWYCWHHISRTGTNPVGRPLRLFFHWHRAYLYRFEWALRDASGNYDITIPWIDYTSPESRQSSIPKLFGDPEIDGRPNPLLSVEFPKDLQRPNRTHTVRNIQPPAFLPSRAQLSIALRKTDFEDAELYIENYIHDNYHGHVGGSMGSVATSAFDIIFYSHHCSIDRLYHLWQLRHGLSTGVEDMMDECLTPFDMKVKDVLDIHQLGYDYGVTTREI